jgi:hypothetical protein
MFEYKENHSFYWARTSRGTLKATYAPSREAAIKQLKLKNVIHKELSKLHLEGVVTLKAEYVKLSKTTRLFSCGHISEAPADVQTYFITHN